MRHADLFGLALLVEYWTKTVSEQKQIVSFGVGVFLKYFFKLHRIWDLVGSCNAHDPQELCRYLNIDDVLFDSIEQNDEKVIFHFLGLLGEHCDYQKLLDKYVPFIDEKQCEVNLTYCSGVETLGKGFLKALKKHEN